MRTKIIYKDFQINNVPFERIEFDAKEKYTRILLDDIHEKRWVIKPVVEQALKITTMDCVYYEKGELNEECFVKKDNSFPIFQRHILEVEDSEWIKELKDALKRVDPHADIMEKSRHFILPLYDSQIEFVAWDIILEELSLGER